MKTLAYHEAVPGHHFQLSIAMSLTHLPFFRRVLPFTAYCEGWALYTEQLAAEQGYYNEDWKSYIGFLDARLMRAVRLVVDTGIHANSKRWSREQAIDYMKANTVMQESEVITEIERYFVLPGQACAYAVGCEKICQLRDKVIKAMGTRYHVKRFHEAVLLNGSLPLTVLEQVVDDYLARA